MKRESRGGLLSPEAGPDVELDQETRVEDWSPEDRAALADLAEQLEPHTEEIAREWAERLASSVIPPSGDSTPIKAALGSVNLWLFAALLQRLRDGDLRRLFRSSRRYNEALLASQVASEPRFRSTLGQLNASLEILTGLVLGHAHRILGNDPRLPRMLSAFGRIALRSAQITGATFHEHRSKVLRQSLRVTSALLESARELNCGARSVDEMTARVAEVSRHSIRCDRSVVFLWSAAAHAYALAGHSGLADEERIALEGLHLSHRDLPLVAHSLAKGIDAGTRGESLIPRGLLARHGIGAYAMTPMIANDGRPLGAIAVLRREEVPFDDSDAAILRGLGQNAALAIENAMLGERLSIAERRRNEVAATARDAERRRVARELHDCVLQDLGGVKLCLESVMRRRPQEELAPIIGGIMELIADVRRVVDDLRHPDLGNLSFRQAIAAHARVLAHREGIAIDLDLPTEIELASWATRDVYRIAQEAIANATRHADPSRLRVRLSRANGANVLEVADDGVGFDTATFVLGSGILGMRERAAAIGAEFEIESIPGRGTAVRVTLPLNETPPWATRNPEG
jgi:signal transduction histidine kinase